MTDKTPFSPFEKIQPVSEWRVLEIFSIVYVRDFAQVQVLDGIENDRLKEIRCIDSDTGQIYSLDPMNWHYSESTTDFNVYMIYLMNFKDIPKFEGR
ncbi:hypothetical protein EH221_07030 [bacterium]|nr:MAG: hypothetical protein EH221_07030 [bacterium]